MPAAQNAVIGAVPPTAIGKASGTFNTLRQLGGASGVAIAAAVFASAGGYSSAGAFSSGFAAALSLGSAVAGAWVPGRRPSRPAVPGRPEPAVVGGSRN